ncbi:RNA polymerase sigma factor [Brevibacillus dissolubilis]|uniref:RNA polymerase sigma factor n=1 Tax=Brevibacillus dissolubilis TaxID=1844116 RepID=UPI001115BC18|nr:sigma-70 family RNA polymerase sigma factor [Brevibacillus dissolubilis]
MAIPKLRWGQEGRTPDQPQTGYFESRSFDELYDEYFDRVNRYLRSRVHNPWDADDLTTTVFLKALEKFGQYSRTSPFAAWIFCIAHNTFIDFVRKQREMPSDNTDLFTSETDDTWQPEQQALTSEEGQVLRGKMERLTRDQRDVLTLRYFGDLKVAQVAELLGKTESSVKTITYRALRELKRLYMRESEQAR